MNFLCIAKKTLSALVSVLLAFSISASAAAAPGDDDFLLLVVPSLIAASQNRGEPTPPVVINPLNKIKELGGDWVFNYPDFSDEFRFYTATAKLDSSDSRYATIDGAEFISNFSAFIANNVSGAYNARDNVYAVFHQWGPPTINDPEGGGSMFFFRAASRNTPGFDCHFFSDWDGNIDDYYIGYGGSIACEPLTKVKVSSQALAAQAARHVDPGQNNAAKYQAIRDRRYAQAALNRAGLAADNMTVSPYQDIYEYLKQNLPTASQ